MEIHSSNRSISDTESVASHFDSFHSDDSPPPQSARKQPARYEVAAERAQRGRGGGEDEVVGGERRSRSKREVMVKRAELGVRVCEVMFCLISFLVMVADKTRGWSGDSYYRYIEYRYCACVTAIGFVYSGLQACDLAFGLIRGRQIIFHHIPNQFDFALDQILAYFLMSAASSAATRVNEWVSNWGPDQFTHMAAASIVMSFLAFAAFSISSLISGYNLFM